LSRYSHNITTLPYAEWQQEFRLKWIYFLPGTFEVTIGEMAIGAINWNCLAIVSIFAQHYHYTTRLPYAKWQKKSGWNEYIFYQGLLRLLLEKWPLHWGHKLKLLSNCLDIRTTQLAYCHIAIRQMTNKIRAEMNLFSTGAAQCIFWPIFVRLLFSAKWSRSKSRSRKSTFSTIFVCTKVSLDTKNVKICKTNILFWIGGLSGRQ
jgi:hypothetical protein